MRDFHLDFVVKAVNGKIMTRQQEIFDGVATDTRKNMRGQLFVALKGDSFDAHDFLAKAIEQEAAGLLVHDVNHLSKESLQNITVILVEDTLLALQNLATAVRRKNVAKVIGIAGSNGKTTSKEFTAALLGSCRKVHYSKGSFNNHWGVPFTLLAQTEDTEFAVVEMGMNHAGELARLAEIAEPDICVCTYVGVEHIEHFGTLEKIAEAEAEIYTHSPESALRIFNVDNSYTRKMWEDCKRKFPQGKIITFSDSEKADVSLKLSEVTMESLTVVGQIGGQKGSVTVPVFGKHNVTNLMVAASVGLACGLSPEQIWSGLVFCKTTWGRNQLVATESGAQILFDGYNSNPDSMRALVENISLVQSSGRKMGVFAEMRELGNLAAELHRETGKYVGKSNLDVIWFYGPHSSDFVQGLREAHFAGEILAHSDFDAETSRALAGRLRSGDIALVKGSRGMALERFVEDAKPLDWSQK